MSFITLLVVTFVIVLCAVLAMAVGVLTGRDAIKGSCGGVGPDGSCPRCTSPGACPRRGQAD